MFTTYCPHKVYFLFRTLAGSTIMLLTLAWGGSLFLGRCDLDDNGEAIEETGEGVNCRKQVIKIISNKIKIPLMHS